MSSITKPPSHGRASSSGVVMTMETNSIGSPSRQMMVVNEQPVYGTQSNEIGGSVKEVTENDSFLQRMTKSVVMRIERSFARFGRFVGKHPLVTLFSSFVVFGLCMVGLLNNTTESRPDKLWLDQASPLISQQEWVSEHFPMKMRYVKLIFFTKDVLTKHGLLELLEIDRRVKQVYANATDEQLHWQNICYRSDEHAPCVEQSILELWRYNESTIRRLTKEDIVRAVNVPDLRSPITHQRLTMADLLGSVSGNGTHAYSSAGKAKMIYLLRKEETLNKKTMTMEDPLGLNWEKEFARVIRARYSSKHVLYSTYTSFLEAGMQALNGDVPLLFLGYLLVIIFLITVLGKFSRLEHKIWLGLAAILVIGLSMGSAYGLCAACGVVYTRMHEILPFLFLGIGVDDVFVIVQCWENLSTDQHDGVIVQERIARTMKHAGVAITVTSLTDFIAFIISASTVLPALRSFCIYAGVGIFFLFFYSCTTFMACLALDTQRQIDRRDACCPLFIQLPADYNPHSCSRPSRLKNFIGDYFTRYLFTNGGKGLVILVTLTLFGVGIYGGYSIEQNSLFESFLAANSEEMNFRNADQKTVHHVAVYVGDIDYFGDHEKLNSLYKIFRGDKYIEEDSVVSWFEHYQEWMEHNKFKGWKSNETYFYESATQFINLSAEGRQYKNDVRLKNRRIVASRLRGKHKLLTSRMEETSAMESVRAECNRVVFRNGFKPFALSLAYTEWETNAIIKSQVVRNLAIAGGVCLLVTFLLIADLVASILVFISVLFTVTDLLGFLYFWGVGIDGIVSMVLVVALGFSVDYSAHIGYAFMHSRKGNRNVRARKTLIDIGPAVFNGGMSTFIAFLLLAASKSTTFHIFFKIFFFVVLFGLFHGMIFLPVLLSIIGPAAYSHVSSDFGSQHEMIEGVTNKGYDTESCHSFTKRQNQDISSDAYKENLTSRKTPTDAVELAVNDTVVTAYRGSEADRIVDDIVYIIAHNAPIGSIVNEKLRTNVVHVRSADESRTDSGISDDFACGDTRMEQWDGEADACADSNVYALRLDCETADDSNLCGEQLEVHNARLEVAKNARLEVVSRANRSSSALPEVESSSHNELFDYMYALRVKLMELLPNVNIRK